MEYIYTITSEDEIRENCFEHLRRYKVVDSSIYYLDEGADLYYQIGSSNTELYENSNYFTLLHEHVSTVDSIISLGCGNSLREKKIIKNLAEKQQLGDDFQYVGIDTSITMLNLSMQELADISMKKKLICADFSSQKLRNDLLERLSEENTNVFTFLGATMGNLGVEYSMDLLSDITTSGDYLMLDVRVRQNTHIVEDRRLYEYYRDNYVYGEANNKNIFSALSIFGVTADSGDVGLEMVQNDSLHSLEAKLKFFVNQPIVQKYRGRNMSLMPGDTITLKTYIAVHYDSLIKYLAKRGFNQAGYLLENEFGYFLFQKQ